MDRRSLSHFSIPQSSVNAIHVLSYPNAPFGPHAHTPVRPAATRSASATPRSRNLTAHGRSIGLQAQPQGGPALASLAACSVQPRFQPRRTSAPPDGSTGCRQDGGGNSLPSDGQIFADQRCSAAIMAFLRETDVGGLAPPAAWGSDCQ